jgi:biopolymer transport protein ExbD
VCDLPARVAGQAEATGLAALVLPASGAGDETLVFFDDARYSLSDKMSVDVLRDRLSVRAGAEPSRTFLLLADRRVPAGDIMRLVDLARGSGLTRVQIAERRE